MVKFEVRFDEKKELLYIDIIILNDSVNVSFNEYSYKRRKIEPTIVTRQIHTSCIIHHYNDIKSLHNAVNNNTNYEFLYNWEKTTKIVDGIARGKLIRTQSSIFNSAYIRVYNGDLLFGTRKHYYNNMYNNVQGTDKILCNDYMKIPISNNKTEILRMLEECWNLIKNSTSIIAVIESIEPHFSSYYVTYCGKIITSGIFTNLINDNTFVNALFNNTDWNYTSNYNNQIIINNGQPLFKTNDLIVGRDIILLFDKKHFIHVYTLAFDIYAKTTYKNINSYIDITTNIYNNTIANLKRKHAIDKRIQEYNEEIKKFITRKDVINKLCVLHWPLSILYTNQFNKPSDLIELQPCV